MAGSFMSLPIAVPQLPPEASVVLGGQGFRAAMAGLLPLHGNHIASRETDEGSKARVKSGLSAQ